MGTAKLRIDLDFLFRALSLPDNIQVLTGVVYNGDLILVVDHPDIPDTAIEVNARFRRQEPVVFDGWRVTQDIPKESL